MLEIAALYHFGALPSFAKLQAPLLETCKTHGIRGTLLLAEEGINGTLAGESSALHAAIDEVRRLTGFDTLTFKSSFAESHPFKKMKVRLKKEIVTLGVPTVSPLQAVGTYVEPHEWNALLSDPEIVLIDTRNAYEVRIGTFRGARDPHTQSFRELPEYVNTTLDPKVHKKIAMFCTGGIRCEKASSYMLGQGFEEVYHLRGGILKYLETVPESASTFDGSCFVFDERVAVDHGLIRADYTMCKACGEPLSAKDRAHPAFVLDARCGFCVGARVL